MNKGIDITLKVVVPLAFGLLVLWLLYRNMDMEAFVATLRSDANFGIILIASLFGTFGNSFRGLRWNLLNRGLSKESSTLNSVLTVQGNYLVNLALPRLGDVWRVGAMAHYSDLKFSQLLGTLFADRVVDVLTIVVLILLGLSVNASFFRNFNSANPDVVHSFQSLCSSPLFYLCIAVLGVGVIALIIWVRRSSKKKSILHNVTEGFKTIATMQKKWLFYLYTIAIWVCYFLQFYITFFAFSFTQDIGVSAAFLTFVMGSIGLLIPTQGGIGGWHLMVIYSLVGHQVAYADAQNFALIVHTFQAIIWTSFIGVISLVLLPIVNRSRNTISKK